MGRLARISDEPPGAAAPAAAPAAPAPAPGPAPKATLCESLHRIHV